MSSLRFAMLWLLVLCLAQAGCGGMSQHLALTPIALDDQGGRDMSNKAIAGPWVIELDDVAFRVSPVFLSSKTTLIFGPGVIFPTFGEDYEPQEGSLSIGLSADFKRNSEATLGFDPCEFLIVLEDGRTLSPVAVRTRYYGNSEELAELEPVTFSNGKCSPGCSLLKHSSKRYTTSVSLKYDISLIELAPFTLKPGALIVNEEAVQLPPLSFVHGVLIL